MCRRGARRTAAAARLGHADAGIGHDLGRRADAFDAPVHDQRHPVSNGKRGQAVGDHDDGAAARVGLELTQQLLFRSRVEGAGRLVENEDARIADQGAGDADQLPLSHRQSLPPFAQHGVVALRQALDEIMGAHELGHRHDAAGILVGDAHGDVFPHRTGEELQLLRHAADLAAKLRRRNVRNVGTVDHHPPARWAEQSLDEIGDRGLARPGRSDDSQDLAGGDVEVGILQDRGHVIVGTIGDALEGHIAHERRHRCQRPGGSLDGFAHQPVDAPEGGRDCLQLMPGRHQLAHRLQGTRRQHIDGDQCAHRQAMIDDLADTDGDDRQRRQQLQGARSAGGDVGQVVGAKAGPGGLFDTHQPALFGLGLEPERLDGGGVGNRLGQCRTLGRHRLEAFFGKAALGPMGGQRHADHHRDRQRRDHTQRGTDGERRAEEKHDEGDVDGEHRHLAGEEAAQHVELAQAFGDDARRRPLEVSIGKLHQVMEHFAAHEGVEPGAGSGRHPAARYAKREVERIGDQHADAEHDHDRCGTLRPVSPSVTSDHPVEHQHHEERCSEAEDVDDERHRGKLQHDRSNANPQRRVPLLVPFVAVRLAHHQGPCPQRHHFVGGQTPDAPFDDVEHGPLAASTGHDDVGGLVGRADHSEGSRKLIQPLAGKIDCITLESQSLAGREKGALVEARRRNCRQPSHVGFADRPSDLLGDIEQRPHERIDRPAGFAIPGRLLEAAVL